jgi:hypothetical protein
VLLASLAGLAGLVAAALVGVPRWALFAAAIQREAGLSRPFMRVGGKPRAAWECS